MRIVYLTTEFLGSALLLKTLAETIPNHQLLAVFTSKRRGPKFLVQMLKHSGFRYVFYLILVGALYRVGYAILRSWNRLLGKRCLLPSLEFEAKLLGIPLFRTEDIHSEEAKTFLKGLEPDLVISLFWDQILRPEVLSIPTIACINIHNSLLPKYPGQGPTIHALAQDDRTVGVTIHFMDERIDRGDILFNRQYPVTKFETVISIDSKLINWGIAEIPNLIAKFEKSNLKGKPQVQNGKKYHFHPNRAELSKFFLTGNKLFTWTQYLRLCISTFYEFQRWTS